MEVDQGSMGQMEVSYSSYGGDGGFESQTFDGERPLLEELGIDLELIRRRVSELVWEMGLKYSCEMEDQGQSACNVIQRAGWPLPN